MAEDAAHASAVDEWLAATCTGLSAAARLRQLGLGFHAVWSRAHTALGDVTLGAIVERVRLDAAERHPCLAELRLEAGTLDLDRLRARSDASPQELVIVLRGLLIDLLSALGALCAEILSPALHAALAEVGTTPGAKAHG
jgi:hypothetical protein